MKDQPIIEGWEKELNQSMINFWKEFWFSNIQWEILLRADNEQIPVDSGEFWLLVRMYQKSREDRNLLPNIQKLLQQQSNSSYHQGVEDAIEVVKDSQEANVKHGFGPGYDHITKKLELLLNKESE